MAVEVDIDVGILKREIRKSNGVIDPIPDKDAVFSGIFRLLRPGGRIQFAGVTILVPVSEEGVATSASEYPATMERH